MAFTYRNVKGSALSWAELDENFNLVEQYHDQSQESAEIALAAANFKGNWSSLTGPLSIPASVYHNSAYWILLSNVADVTAAQPGVSAAWGGMAAGITVNSSVPALKITQSGSGPALLVEDQASDTTPFVIDASGKVQVGYSTAWGGITAPAVGVDSITSASFAQTWFAYSAARPIVSFVTGGGTSFGSNTAVASGRSLGTFRWYGTDGTAPILAASIDAVVDTTPGTNDMPGRLVFSTTSDGASSPTERLRIDSSGASRFTGDVVVPSMNGGQLAGLRNKIINGNFSINQRAVTGTVVLAAGAYGHDRWKAGASGCTYTFATSNNVTTLTISAGSLQQVIEGANLQSGTHTLSWSGTAQGKIGAGSYSATGVTGSATGGTNLTIEFNTGTLSLIRLEPGNTSTPFEFLPVGLELALCQRYYYREQSESTALAPYGGHVQVLTTTSARLLTRFPVPMRVRPTALEQSGTAANWQIVHGASATALNAVPTYQNATTTVAAVDLAVASGLTVGQVGYLRATNTTNTFLAWSAEP